MAGGGGVNKSVNDVQAAWRELAAAFEDGQRAYGLARRTLRYEDLLPVADRLNQTLGELVGAFAPLIREVTSPSEPAGAAAHGRIRSVQPERSEATQLAIRITDLHDSARRLRASTKALENEMERSRGLIAVAARTARADRGTAGDNSSH